MQSRMQFRRRVSDWCSEGCRRGCGLGDAKPRSGREVSGRKADRGGEERLKGQRTGRGDAKPEIAAAAPGGEADGGQGNGSGDFERASGGV